MDAERKPNKLLGTIGTVVLFVAIAVVAVYGFAHATLRPINPEQKPAKGHFETARCSICHSLSKDVKLVDVDE